ncbi:hypothetical protein Dda_3567 [Drechslerella dactyloides]|uniref:Uncharacterized protein n=1 Tax=Drechslerella dactyloides TaxID=74499 RepID=A0AAD6NIL3_DREDA|nr:hypothetical protein Dda_3567 [Drechslerella dactyloides]
MSQLWGRGTILNVSILLYVSSVVVVAQTYPHGKQRLDRHLDRYPGNLGEKLKVGLTGLSLPADLPNPVPKVVISGREASWVPLMSCGCAVSVGGRIHIAGGTVVGGDAR